MSQQRAPFTTRGRETRRNFGEWPGDGRGRLTVAMTSGWQQWERAVEVAEALALYEAVLSAERQLAK